MTQISKLPTSKTSATQDRGPFWMIYSWQEEQESKDAIYYKLLKVDYPEPKHNVCRDIYVFATDTTPSLLSPAYASTHTNTHAFIIFCKRAVVLARLNINTTGDTSQKRKSSDPCLKNTWLYVLPLCCRWAKCSELSPADHPDATRVWLGGSRRGRSVVTCLKTEISSPYTSGIKECLDGFPSCLDC